MPIVPPSLDDRSYDDLVQELLARIPAHAPEYTHPVPGDPGRTLIELFAWLGDALLYRVNLIPERQRLVFLSLLGIPLRPATPARTVLSLGTAQPRTLPFTLLRGARVEATPPFETLAETTVLPVTAAPWVKRRVQPGADRQLDTLLRELEQLHNLRRGQAAPYTTRPAFPDGQPLDPASTLDRSVWLALLADKPVNVEAVRANLAGQRACVAVAPVDAVPGGTDPIYEAATRSRRHGATWQVSARVGLSATSAIGMLPAAQVSDSTAGLSRPGVITLILPDAIAAPPNDVRRDPDAGVGDRPPRLDDADQAARLVGWLRLQLPADGAPPLAWVGINGVEVEARTTTRNVVFATSDGAPDQTLQLPAGQVDPDSLEIEVEEEGVGYRAWTRVDVLATAGPDDSDYELDAEAGLVRLGDGLRGRVPVRGARVRVVTMRAGGGGDLPPGRLKDVSGPTDVPVAGKITAVQALPATGGQLAETLTQAERRIPSFLAHRDRAVSAEDFAALTRETPGVRIGRVEVLPGLRPATFDEAMPGVVSVVVLPAQAEMTTPAPRADRRLIEAVHGWLEPRRLVGTELYVVGPAYVPIGVSVAVEIRPGFDREATLMAAREAVRRFLWPLPPGGPFEATTGWPLGRPVRDRELEVAVARVPGVDEIREVALFEVRGDGLRRVAPRDGVASLPMRAWELPELLRVDAGDGAKAPDLAPLSTGTVDEIGVPVVPEVC
jgi:hypothetical protein